MPTIIEYFGIVLKFFSKEHLPIHVHAYYGGGYGMKVEFYFKGNDIVKKQYKTLKGYSTFKPAQMRDLKKLIDKYEYDIANDWVTFVIKNQRVTRKIIRRKIR